MRLLIALALAFGLAACNGSRSSAASHPNSFSISPAAPPAPSGYGFATAAPGSHSYTLSAASSLAVSGPAVYVGGTPTQLLLAVDVRDENGSLCDLVKVRFRASGGTVLGLGDSMSGWPLPGIIGDEHGRAFTVAEPYEVGTVPVIADVDPGNGSSNQVLFLVTGR